MKKFSNYMEFTMGYGEIPTDIALDVFKRIADWLSSGGSVEDDYVKQQLEYASKFIAKG